MSDSTMTRSTVFGPLCVPAPPPPPAVMRPEVWLVVTAAPLGIIAASLPVQMGNGEPDDGDMTCNSWFCNATDAFCEMQSKGYTSNQFRRECLCVCRGSGSKRVTKTRERGTGFVYMCVVCTDVDMNKGKKVNIKLKIIKIYFFFQYIFSDRKVSNVKSWIEKKGY